MKQILLSPTTPETQHLPWVDFSGLTAVSTCPRWGVIHSIHGKRMPHGESRAMALEAGSAMHDVFAAVRMFDLIKHLGSVPDDLYAYGKKLFTNKLFPDRWDRALEYIKADSEDAATQCMQFALYMLETSGFHDDPNDKRRTQSNLEVAAIMYVERYPLGRYIPVYNEGHIDCGIEVPFDITLNIDGVDTVRFVGKVDGVCRDHQQKHLPIEVHENKTGARIDTTWAVAFEVGHQPTGYTVAISTLLQKRITDCVIWGTQIPVPKSSSFGDGSMRYPVSRNDEQVIEWMRWVGDTLDVINRHIDAPTEAPMYTHSCNRYFRSCSLIPLCVESREQRKKMFDNEMITERWNPLEQAEGVE